MPLEMSQPRRGHSRAPGQAADESHLMPIPLDYERGSEAVTRSCSRPFLGTVLILPDSNRSGIKRGALHHAHRDSHRCASP